LIYCSDASVLGFPGKEVLKQVLFPSGTVEGTKCKWDQLT